MTIKEVNKKYNETPASNRDARFFLNILKDHFLGENWYSMYWNHDDIDLDMVRNIIMNNPYRIKNFKRRFKYKINKIIQIVKE